MNYFYRLSQEIQDKIFLLTDFKTIELNKNYISKYVKQITRYKTFTNLIKYQKKEYIIKSLIWFEQNKLNVKFDINSAIKNNCSIETLEWIINHSEDLDCSSEYSASAVEVERLDILQWLYKKGFPLNYVLYNDIANVQNMDMLVWLNSLGIDNQLMKTGYVYIITLKHDNIEMLDWFYKHDFPLDLRRLETSIRDLIFFGNLSSIIWLKNHGIQFTNHILVICAAYSKIRFIEYLMNNYDLRLREEMYFEAIVNDDRKLLLWLYEHHCPWSYKCYEKAYQTDNKFIFKWLKKVGCPSDIYSTLINNF